MGGGEILKMILADSKSYLNSKEGFMQLDDTPTRPKTTTGTSERLGR
jgi:hypothetical protein